MTSYQAAERTPGAASISTARSLRLSAFSYDQTRLSSAESDGSIYEKKQNR
jgi:hypothetical protein